MQFKTIYFSHRRWTPLEIGTTLFSRRIVPKHLLRVAHALLYTYCSHLTHDSTTALVSILKLPKQCKVKGPVNAEPGIPRPSDLEPLKSPDLCAGMPQVTAEPIPVTGWFPLNK